MNHLDICYSIPGKRSRGEIEEGQRGKEELQVGQARRGDVEVQSSNGMALQSTQDHYLPLSPHAPDFSYLTETTWARDEYDSQVR